MTNSTKLIILCLLILLSLVTVVLSFHYSNSSGGTDLRNRVVGSRAMKKGYSPYFYKWHPSDGETLLDPNDSPTRLANGNTVTPAVFYILYPFISMPYPLIRLLWTITEYMAVLLLIYIMLKRYTVSPRLMPSAIVILGIFTSNYWLFHLERGQISIFYSLFFALMFYCYTSKGKYGEYISGFIGGLFMFFRPFAAVLCIGFLLKRKIKWLYGFSFGSIAALILFVAPNIQVWKDYFRVIKEYGLECQNQGHTIENAPVYSMPSIIETAKNLGENQKFETNAIPTMNWYIQKAGFNYTFLRSNLTCVTLLFIFSLLFYKSKNRSSAADLFLFSFLCYMIIQLFALNWRGAYAVIEWAFPLFLIVQLVVYRSSLLTLLIIALLFLHRFPFYFRYQYLFGEPLLIFLIVYLLFEKRTGTKSMELTRGLDFE